MSPSKYIIEKSQGLLKEVTEYRDEGKGYTAVNDGSTECEVLDFLYGMVRVLKPSFVLETGTYKGFSSTGIGQALKDNNRGILDTFEINEEHINTSKQLWTMLDLFPKWIKVHHQPAQEFTPVCNYDLLFLDSEMNLRLHELVKFYPYLNEGGYVFIHDFPPTLCFGNKNPDHPDYPNWPVGDFPKGFDKLLQEDKLRLFHFPSPRGMIGFYRPKKGEYKWKEIEQ